VLTPTPFDHQVNIRLQQRCVVYVRGIARSHQLCAAGFDVSPGVLTRNYRAHGTYAPLPGAGRAVLPHEWDPQRRHAMKCMPTWRAIDWGVGRRAAITAGADKPLVLCARVLVEREPPADQWAGPYTVASHRDNLMWLEFGAALRAFNAVHVRPFHPPLSQPEARFPDSRGSVESGSGAGVPGGHAGKHSFPPEAPWARRPKVTLDLTPGSGPSVMAAPTAVSATTPVDLWRTLDTVIECEKLLATAGDESCTLSL